MASSKSGGTSCLPSKKRCETIAKIVGASRLRLKDRETISNLAASPPLSLFLLPVIPAPRTPVSRISYRLYQPARQNAPSGIGWAICCQTWSIKVCQVLSVLNCYLDGLPHPLPLLLLLIVLLTTGLPQPVSSFTAVYGVSQTYRDQFPRRNYLIAVQSCFLPNNKSQRDIIVKIFRKNLRRKDLRVFKFENNNREFSTRGNDEIFMQRIYGRIRIKFISNIAEWSWPSKRKIRMETAPRCTVWAPRNE